MPLPESAKFLALFGARRYFSISCGSAGEVGQECDPRCGQDLLFATVRWREEIRIVISFERTVMGEALRV